MQTNDQLRATIELDSESGRFEIDGDGYTRVFLEEEELKRVEIWLGDEITRTRDDLAAVFAECAENIETYKAIKMHIDGAGPAILPSPIARNPADQIISTTVNKVAQTKPIFSFDPYFNNTYKVPVPLEVPMPDPTTGQVAPRKFAVAVDVDSEQLSQRWEVGMEFKNRERLRFIPLFHRTVHDCVTAGLGYVKVCRRKKTRTLIAPKVKGAILDFTDTEELYIRDGEDVHWYNVAYSNVLRPNMDDEIDDLPWVSEILSHESEDITKGFYNEEYFLIRDEDDAKALAGNVTQATTREKERTDATTRNLSPQVPHLAPDVHEVFFFRNLKVRIVDQKTGKEKIVVRRFDLMGEFHVGARRLLSLFRNPYNHQRRLLVPFTQFLDGSSTVGIIKYHQIIGTHLQQAEIKNSFHGNNFTYWWNPDSIKTAKFFNGRKTIEIGEIIPGVYNTDWGVVRAGEGFTYSLLPLMQWNNGESQTASRQSSYEMGETIPGRTPSSTVQQILERGGQPGNLFLLRLSEGFAKVMRLYLETARQFQPMGETIPVRDKGEKAILEIPFRYPIGDALDNFRIALTASDQMLAKEHAPEEIATLMNLYQQHTGFVAQVAGPIAKASPAEADFFRRVIAGETEVFDKLVSMLRTDTKEKFDLMPAVDALVEEAKAAAQQMEAMNAEGQVTGAGGAVPGAEGGAQPGGDQGAPGEQPLPPNPDAAPAASVPQGAA
jgi:hypothetical protein